MSESFNTPPLFVSAFRDDGSFGEAMVDQNTRWPHGSGRWTCDVRAPNGARQVGDLDLKEGNVAYQTFFDTLAQRPEVDDLWIDPGHEPVSKTASRALIAWQGDQPLASGKWSIAPASGAHFRGEMRVRSTSEAPITALQYVATPGPSIIMPWSENTSLALLGSSLSSSDGVRPVAVNRTLLAAYWGFARHNAVNAVSALGALALQRLQSEPLIAAHFLSSASSDAVSAETRLKLTERLRASTDSIDSQMMAWVLEFDDRAETDLDSLNRLLSLIVKSIPRYTAVFRKFLENLELVRADFPEFVQKNAATIRFVGNLAAASYWSSELLTYRGLRPGVPDANASGSAISAELKKKSLS